MPDGIVKEFDEKAGRGRIEDNARRYEVADEDIANDAKFAGARVHFDVERPSRLETDEPDRAVNVRLRSGGRHNKNAKRFGDTGGSPTR